LNGVVLLSRDAASDPNVSLRWANAQRVLAIAESEYPTDDSLSPHPVEVKVSNDEVTALHRYAQATQIGDSTNAANMGEYMESIDPKPDVLLTLSDRATFEAARLEDSIEGSQVAAGIIAEIERVQGS